MTARHLSRLRLTAFRNYAAAALDLDSRHVVLTGPNGAGKTNLLEAISVLSPGRGLRGASFAIAVDRVSTIASDRGGKAVKLSAKDGLLELSVTNPDHGTASEELAVEFDTDGFEIGFNARYLLDIIGQIRSESAVFMFNDAGSPTLVKDDGETRAQYVLMPMRV